MAVAVKTAFWILVGGGAGLAWGYLVSCAGSSWAAASSPWLAGFLGGVVGLLFATIGWR